MTSDPNEFFEGIYYDGTVGECYQFELHQEDIDEFRVDVSDPDGGHVEYLGTDEFRDLTDDLYPVPESAVDDPVRYLENEVAKMLSSVEFDTGLLYADAVTEIVESGDGDE